MAAIRGICPVCHRLKPLTKDGTLKNHDVPGQSRMCSGSGQKPRGA